MVLNITSYPRSGNSFFANTLMRFHPIWFWNGHPVRFRPVESLVTSCHIDCQKFGIKPAALEQGVVDGVEDPCPDRHLVDREAVYVYKRHDYPDHYSGPRIYLIRDGRDVLISLAKFSIACHVRDEGGSEGDVQDAMKPDWINREALRITLDPNVQWGHCVLRGISHPSTVTVVRYRDMIQDPIGVAKAALRRAGFEATPLPDARVDFRDLHEKHPSFYSRGFPGGFHDLDPSTIRLFESRNFVALQSLGYINR